ncbi:unnamed protein product [Phyllotreta striolata]|uniref:FAM20 C-terminal domain-containing protein n=1 Tax=Phyllotreta striolata TaxID=444603 RepID=A0A9N9TT61_PHYSR|nr:unnamed protein product [Phyllotreta striolata]
MFRRKTILIIGVIFSIGFLLSTNYLNFELPKGSDRKIVDEIIYEELNKLPKFYKLSPKNANVEVEGFFKNLSTSAKYPYKNLRHLWQTANSWTNKDRLVDIRSPYLNDVVTSMKYAKITGADLDHRGTQLKLILTLEGNQQVIFKPKWYDIRKVLEGPVYVGKDRFNSEIIAFYLSLMLKKPLCPVSTTREISLQNDILPVASKRLLETVLVRNNRTCVYGKCFFCNRNDPICDNENARLEGAVIFNFKANLVNHRSPWQRTYKKDKNALWQEYTETYCDVIKAKLSKRRLYDLVEVSIFDFLMQNGDRHHYETIEDNVLWLDNGKGLGNPYKHHLDILAPLYQCCMLRKTMYDNLLKLRGGGLLELLNGIPDVERLITNEHLKAIDERLLLVFATIEYCKKGNGDSVFDTILQ